MSDSRPHKFVPAALGHSDLACVYCGGSPAETAALGEANHCDKAPAPEATKSEGDWSRVEIFGHRVRCGLVTEVDRFGTKLCQIACYREGETEPFAVEQYGGSSIFSLTPCTEEYARDYHRRYDPPPRLALPPAASFEEADEPAEFKDDAA